MTGPSDEYAPGTRVGDYTLDAEHAREETGIVYPGTHALLPRKAFVKIVGGTPWSKPHAVQLLREACLLEALQHPGIPRVFECGVMADRRPWVAFQRIEGPTLSVALNAGPMAIGDLVALLRDVADILVHAHARGVVHTRVNAETIVRTPDRPHSVCLRGWSNARTVETTQALDAREDVYALGSIAFRALTGCLHNPTVSATDWCPSAPAEPTALIDVMHDATPRVRPTSEEVRERARWLSTTVELVKPRWTPPNGLDRDTHQALPTTSAFSIRIGRSITK